MQWCRDPVFIPISASEMSANSLAFFPPSSRQTTMESDTRQSSLVSSSAVRYYLSIACLGWYTAHWFIQLVGVYAASVTSSIAVTSRTTRLPTVLLPAVDEDTVHHLQDLPAVQLPKILFQEFRFYAR